MKHYVYKITNIKENKHYIGVRSAENPSRDLGIKYFSSSSDNGFMLEQQEFPERFEYKILEVFSSRDLAIAKEIELHDKYDVAVNESFYNRAKQTSSGFCRVGTKQSDEAKRKIGLFNKGKVNSKETRDKISNSLSGENHIYYGKRRSKETIEKIRAAKIGKNNPMWGLIGELNPNYGRKHSDETIEKMSGRNNHNYGKRGKLSHNYGLIRSDETKKKMSESRTGSKNHNYGKTGEKSHLYGIPRTTETKRKISETSKIVKRQAAIESAYRFIIRDHSDIIIHNKLIVNFAKFCTENFYPVSRFCVSHRTNSKIPSGEYKGWSVKRISE